MDYKALLQKARKIMENSYSPYSKFRVGAVVLCESGNVYTGVNIENSSFGATICAERTAICKAISEGEKKIKAVVVASDLDDYIFPCGICRQFIGEFMDEDGVVICSNKKDEYLEKSFKEIFPNFFRL